MMSWFFEVEGIPQRQQMCPTCPSRLVSSRGSVERHLLDNKEPHRCHSMETIACAGNRASTPAGLRELVKQIEKEQVN